LFGVGAVRGEEGGELEMDKRYIVNISGGAYSDYWEHWYWSAKPLTVEELADLLEKHAARAQQILDGRNIERWEWKTEFETILMELCGLVLIEPDLSVDVGYESLCDAEQVARFADAVRRGEAY